MSRAALAIALFLAAALPACSASSESPEAGPEPVGAVGSHVWFHTSVRFQLMHDSSIYNWQTHVTSQYTSCVAWDRGELGDDQLSALEAIELVPLDERCTSDGYSYEQLTVFDMDGSEAVYRDTGCDYLNHDATAMLPRDSFDEALFPWDLATDCSE